MSAANGQVRRIKPPPVLCAFDPSTPSHAAARMAGWLAVELRAPLELVHVFDPGELPALPREGAAADPVLRARAYAAMERAAERQAHDALETLAAELPAADVAGYVPRGRPAEVLRRLAADRRVALLVCGTAARRGLEAILEGSVAGSLAATAACPVVTVGTKAAIGEPGPVLAGDDGSEQGRAALRHASALADRLGRELLRTEVEDGDPVVGLARTGRECRACLVVVGSRGRGPLREQLLGSVSTGLVRSADRPVAIVPPEADAPAFER
jgi:nucleotide-binding universal stress UspA family protein